ncbi:MAG: tRNA epoxyqueuosine(34) reductase QueG [Planctomycetota bacterium]|nr:MAG: tRNA epoxyqueuosine(34) reductase QueG [Planctomycetota bacterium]
MVPPARILQEMALEAGFDLVGIGAIQDPQQSEHFLHWLDAGHQADMAYLARNRERIAAPDRWRPKLRSGLSVAIDYNRPEHRLGGAKIARYALGRDYHRAMGKRLERLKKRLVGDGIAPERLHFGVDAVPFLERALAVRSGIGFFAKSNMVISPRRGPWLLLGELLVAAEFEAEAPSPGSCGTCTACLDACPTQAFVGPFELDARRCLSYTSIESRGPIPYELREAQSQWLFGCDICVEVCPFARREKESPEDPDLRLHPVLETYDLLGVLELEQEDWNRDWVGSAIRRATRNGLRRNAALALARSQESRASLALSRALQDPDPGVRSSVAWALARRGEERAAVATALDKENDPELRADLTRSLESY